MLTKLPISWFDLIAIVLIGVGLFRGRRRGMSEELLDLFQWLLIIFVGGHAFDPLGKLFTNATGLDLLTSRVIAYLFVAILLKLIFSSIKRAMGEKLIGSDVFGRMEYYLGMISGMVRFFCMVFLFMAVLNARLYSEAEIKESEKQQRENYGSISFPTIASIQTGVFQSLTGQFAKRYMNSQLVTPTTPGQKKDETVGRRRERAVDEIMNSK